MTDLSYWMNQQQAYPIFKKMTTLFYLRIMIDKST